MTDFREVHWHDWSGGECPVDPDDFVVVYMRNTQFLNGHAGEFEWKHEDGNRDIIRFSVFERAPEPKCLWAVRDANGRLVVFSENRDVVDDYAKNCLGNDWHSHTVHRYVEAPE